MSTAAEILVIITSVVLVIFLVLAIILTFLVIRVTSKIKKVAGSAEIVADNIGRATKGLRHAGTPLFFISLLRGIANKENIEKLKNLKKSKKGKK